MENKVKNKTENTVKLREVLRNSQIQFVTLKNIKSGVYYCYRIQKRNDTYFVAVLAGGWSEKFFKTIGFYTGNSTELKPRKADDLSNTDYFKGFQLALSSPERCEGNTNLEINYERALRPY